MSMIQSDLLLGQEGGAGYQIERSLRFSSTDGSFLSRTPASAGNRKTWTISTWLKRASLTGNNFLLRISGTDDATYLDAWINSSGQLFISGYYSYWIQSVPVYRDPSAWYHLVIAANTTAAVASERFKVYVNGVYVTGNYNVAPTLNSDLAWNRTAEHNICGGAGVAGDFLLADFHSIDGQALTPTSFGEFDTNNVWQPKAYSGTYGTNGFKLDFSNNSAATAAALGADSSGRNNNWTPNNLSVNQLIYGSFDGASDYVRTSSNPMVANSTVTIECHFFPLTTNVIGLFDGGANLQNIIRNYPSNQIEDQGGGSVSFTANQNQWNHIAAVISSGVLTVYLNGTSVGSASVGTYAVGTTFDIGTINAGGDGSFNGYIRNFRVSSTVRYSSNFTPPSHTSNFASDADTRYLTLVTGFSDQSSFNRATTVNGATLVTGASNDCLVDSPTNYGIDTGAGAEVRGNYATWNRLASNASLTLSNGNLDCAAPDGNWYPAASTVAVTAGKYYFEYTLSGTVGTSAYNHAVGISTSTTPITATGLLPGFTSTSFGLLLKAASADYYTNSSLVTALSTTMAAGDTCGIAIDVDAGKGWFAAKNTWIGGGNPASGTTPTFTFAAGSQIWPHVSAYGTGTSSTNFGQRPFAYTAPSGFKALCTQSLPTPTITNGATAMDVKLYTGNGGTQTISGLSFSPDFVWIKGRSFSPNHRLYDQIRGATKSLSSDLKNVEGTETTGLTAFTSDGFSLGAQIGHNGSGDTYVAWCWDAGSSTVTNTSGTISSQVRANASAGFSIVSFTSTATTTATVGHGLGVAPDMIILKDRNGSTYDWLVYFAKRTDVVANRAALYLNTSGEGATDNNTPWLSTSPTSSVFTVGGTNLGQYGTMIAYCFAAVNSYSSFGQYTGNGSTDGPFVYTNMRPRWILIKRTNLAANWTIIDTARRGYNVDNEPLYPNLSNAEGTTDLADILSNGFKLRSTDASVNASGGIYVYACFAENPFALARAR